MDFIGNIYTRAYFLFVPRMESAILFNYIVIYNYRNVTNESIRLKLKIKYQLI